MEKLKYMHHAISIILQFVNSNIHEHSLKLIIIFFKCSLYNLSLHFHRDYKKYN